MSKFLFTSGMLIALFSLSQIQAQTQPCCTGAQGAQGPAGIQGVPGIQGPQGIEGPEGPCCPGVVNYANLFSNLNQTLASSGNPGSVVLFEQANAVLATDFDISLAPTTGQITFLSGGIYEISYSTTGLVLFPTPVPTWSFGLFLDNTV
jgi:hypothetical protein